VRLIYEKRVSEIDTVGVVGESAGYACYRVGQKANAIALAKQNRKPIFGKNPGSIAFALPYQNKNDQFKTVVGGLIFIVTIYGYVKLIIAFYRKGQSIALKRAQLKRSKLINKAAKCLVVSC
jgi:hypothetical protein